MSIKIVAVLGASNNPERYSNKAVIELLKNGYNVIPINPNGMPINGIKTYKNLSEIPSGTVHTLTIYVNDKISSAYTDEILKLQPKRVIFNPGTENETLINILKKNNITVETACTLVMLRTKNF